MTAVKKNLYVEQGATFILQFQWCDAGPVINGEVTAGDSKDLTDWTARMQFRARRGATVLMEATTENGLITLGLDDPTDGWVIVELPDETTDLLTVSSAKYDLEAEDPDGKVVRLLQGKVTIDPNITQDVVAP